MIVIHYESSITTVQLQSQPLTILKPTILQYTRTGTKFLPILTVQRLSKPQRVKLSSRTL